MDSVCTALPILKAPSPFSQQPRCNVKDALPAIMRREQPLKDAGTICRRCSRSPTVAYVKAAVGSREMHGMQLLMRGDGEQAKLVLPGPDGPAGIDVRRLAPEGRDVGMGGARVATIALEYILDNLSVAFGASQRSAPRTITFLKIDAEGADATILVSSSPLFERRLVELVVFEANRNMHKRKLNFVTKMKDVVRMLEQHDFEAFLVGYWHERRSFVLTRLDEQSTVFWAAKLETVVAWPADMRREYFLLFGNETAERRAMSPELVVEFWNASVAKITSPKWASKFRQLWGGPDGTRQAALLLQFASRCFPEHLLVPCGSCGGETPRTWG